MDPGFWIGVLAGISVLLSLVLWSARRHRSPKLVVECDEGIERLMTSLAGLTLGMAVGGNRLQVLENGRFFDVLEERIRRGAHTVHFETFLWKPGELGARASPKAFMERARAGVTVRIMLDAQGSKKIEQGHWCRLREAGCKVKFFHKRSIYTSAC
jgi:cardiolipin synthase